MKVTKIVFLIVGSIIGAGFATGAEMFEYFAKFGAISLFFIVPLFFCFFFFIKIFLEFGNKMQSSSFIDKTRILCDRVNIFGIKFNYLNFLLFSTFLILSSAMFAGLVSLFKTYFSIVPDNIIYLFVILFSLMLINTSFNILTKLSYIIVPIIIICLVVISVFSFNIQTINLTLVSGNILPLPILTILYAAQNCFLSSFVIISSGKNLSKNEQKKVCILVPIILCTLLLFGILCFLCNEKIANFDMPFAILASTISPYFSALYGFVIFFSIITTYATTLTSLKEYFKGEKKYNTKIVMLVCIVFLSLLNFNNIISLLYPLIGIFGTIFAYKIVTKFRKKEI